MKTKGFQKQGIQSTSKVVSSKTLTKAGTLYAGMMQLRHLAGKKPQRKSNLKGDGDYNAGWIFVSPERSERLLYKLIAVMTH